MNTKKEKSMSSKKVALVVGHRKHAQGAWGNAGMSEWVFNSRLARRIKERLDGSGVETKIFYRDERPGGYGERMKRLHRRIDDWGADYSISLHFNAAGDSRVNGHEVLYCSKAGKRAAKILNDSFSRLLPASRDRGIKKRTRKQRGGGFLCRGRSVCVLAEPFFAAHQDKFVPGIHGWDALVDAYVDAILQMTGARS